LPIIQRNQSREGWLGYCTTSVKLAVCERLPLVAVTVTA
jgi:hypothetical protein